MVGRLLLLFHGLELLFANTQQPQFLPSSIKGSGGYFFNQRVAGFPGPFNLLGSLDKLSLGSE